MRGVVLEETRRVILGLHLAFGDALHRGSRAEFEHVVAARLGAAGERERASGGGGSEQIAAHSVVMGVSCTWKARR